MAAKTRSRKAKTELTVSRHQLLVNGSDQLFRQFVHDTLAFSARLQAIKGHLGATIGMSSTQYTVLIAITHLSSSDSKVGVNQVAEHLYFSGAFITIEINKLVARGLVEKEIDIADRRRVVLTTTPKAQELLNELAPVQRPVYDTIFRDLSSADFDRTRRLMADMVVAAEDAIRLLEYRTPAPPPNEVE